MAEEEKPAAHTEDLADSNELDGPQSVQTLTDLFDQLDRAAFKRVLEYRDSFINPRKRAEPG